MDTAIQDKWDNIAVSATYAALKAEWFRNRNIAKPQWMTQKNYDMITGNGYYLEKTFVCKNKLQKPADYLQYKSLINVPLGRVRHKVRWLEKTKEKFINQLKKSHISSIQQCTVKYEHENKLHWPVLHSWLTSNFWNWELQCEFLSTAEALCCQTEPSDWAIVDNAFSHQAVSLKVQQIWSWHVGRVGWEADDHCLHSKKLCLLSWMDMDYFFQESLSQAYSCDSSSSATHNVNWNNNSQTEAA